MPPSLAAAALTDGFRQQLTALRDGAADAAVGLLRGVDLDLSKPSLARAMLTWSDRSGAVASAVTQQAAVLSLAYVSAYLRVSGAPVEGKAAVSVAEPELEQVAPALWWRLGQGVGREAAVMTAESLVERVVRSAVGSSATETLAGAIHAEPAVSGWRAVSGPSSCGRCAAAVGTVRSDSARMTPHHPADRCTQEPVLRGVAERVTRSAPTVVAP